MKTKYDAWDHILFLADDKLRGRVPLSEGSKIAREYILDIYEKCGLIPLFDHEKSYIQDIEARGKLFGKNIGGYIKGKRDSYILVGAHYDHFSHSAGADDNAASVGQMIAAIQYFSEMEVMEGKGIIFIAFDTEEPPNFHTSTMGSIYFHENCPIDLEKIDLAIILDLTGHKVPIPGLEECLFVLGSEYSSGLVQEIYKSLKNELNGLKVVCTRNDRVGDMSDHHIFRISKKPFFFLTCGRTEHYHAETDRIENLDPEKIEKIKDYLIELIKVCSGTAIRYEFDNCNNSFLEFEAKQLTELLGHEILPEDVEYVIQDFLRDI